MVQCLEEEMVLAFREEKDGEKRPSCTCGPIKFTEKVDPLPQGLRRLFDGSVHMFALRFFQPQRQSDLHPPHAMPRAEDAPSRCELTCGMVRDRVYFDSGSRVA